MTLNEIWKSHRNHLYLVAVRPGSSSYVPLGIGDFNDLEELSEGDKLATDWYLAEIVPHDCDALHGDQGACELAGTANQWGETHICRDVHLATFRCEKHGQVETFRAV